MAQRVTSLDLDSAGFRRLALAALFVVSAAGLSFEITLTRLFSLFFQYNFAFLALSLAILGLSLGAASGAYLRPERTRSTGTLALVLAALSLSFSGVTLVIAWLPSAESIFPRALVALLPFFLIGLFAALTYENLSSHSGTLYAADLIGAGVGVVMVLALLTIWSAFSMVLFLGALTGLMALAFALRGAESRVRLAAGAGLIVGVGLLAANLASGAVDFDPLRLTGVTRDKTMIAILQDPSQDAKIVYTGWSPFSRVDVVETNDPSAKYIFADGGAGAYLMAYDGQPQTLASMPIMQSIDALPFQSGSAAKTLVVGAGGGKDVLLALNAGAESITAVEVNPAIVAATRHFAAYDGQILDLPQAHWVEGDARSYVERTPAAYDLIYMNLVYTQAVSPATQALVENYIFTTEAFKTYLRRLAPGGRLALVTHNGLEGSRAMLTALQAMQDEGIAPAQALDHFWLWRANDPDQTIATSVLIVGKDALPPTTTDTLNAAAQAQGMLPLFTPRDYETLFAPLRNGTPLSSYIQSDASYNLAPTRDDQPYFFNLDYGIPPAIRSALTLAALLALGLLALALVSDSTPPLNRPRRRATIAYAALIGLGFMLIEVPLIQRFQLLLGQPILSLAAVLATLLLSGGVGSLVSQRWSVGRLTGQIRVAAVWIVVVTVIYWLALPTVLSSVLGASFAARLLAIIVLTALLGFPMGVPFPGLMRLAGEERQQVALLWAINGAFSVLGSTLAMLLSMQWGFTVALLLGAALYAALAAVTVILERLPAPIRLAARTR